MQYFVYIIQSLKDGGYYVGMTCNIESRLDYHNKGRVKSTKSRKPFKLVYTEQFQNRIAAREREKFLKSYSGSKERMSILESLR